MSAIKSGSRYRFGGRLVTVISHRPSTKLRDGTTATDGLVDVLYDNGDTDRVEERTFLDCARIV